MGNVYLTQFSVVVEDQFVMLPYSAGLLWAYAKGFSEISDNYHLSDIFFVKEPLDDIFDKIHEPDVVGFSTYIWNSNYNDALARQIKKAYPNCLIVYGGPQVSGVDDDLFVNKPWIDICVHQEGELAFKEILTSNLKDRDWSKILGISYYKNTFIKTQPGKRLDLDLDTASPYLLGIMDKCIQYP